MLKWSELSARERDALVAEKVMGLTKDDEGVWSSNGVKLYWPDTTCFDEDIWLPEYSKDMTAAWEVVEKLQAFNPFWKGEGFLEFELSPTTGWEGAHGWHCNFGDDKTRAYADTAPEAICLAALKACGVDIE